MRILLTGATGFLGRNLSHFLVEKGYDVTVIGRDVEKLKTFFAGLAVSKRGTDYSAESLVELTRDQDVVIHLASQLMQRDTHPLKISFFDANLRIVENIILACEANKIGKFINTSSISVYPLEQNLVESQATSPWTIYGVSKANIDVYLDYIQKKITTRIVSLRLARLFGYGERAGLMFTDFITKAINKEPLTINGEGKSTIEYIYIEDAIDAISQFVENADKQGVFNVGSGVSYSVKDIAQVVNNVFDNEGNIQFLTDRPDGIYGSVMDISKMKSEMNWGAKWDLVRSVKDIKRKIENERK